MEQLPKYICTDCNAALNIVLHFKAKISERFQEIKSLIEMSMKPIKSEIVFEEVLVDNLKVEELEIKTEAAEVTEPTNIPLLAPAIKIARKRWLKFTGKCFYCQKALASYQEMNEHHKTHTDCHLCPKKYSSYDSFKFHFQNIHLNIVKKDDDQTYSCHICGKEFKRKKNVNVHIRVFHNKERNYACDICDKRFFEKTQLESHKNVHSDERPFVCEICGKNFKSIASLKPHEQIHKETRNANNKYQTNYQLYMCTYCGKQSRGKSAFQLHQRLHTNELPYECTVCNKKFRASTSLTVHKRLHTGEKPYKCSLCPARFRMLPFLKNHKLSHGGNNVKKFNCKLCGMSTVYEGNLETHMKTVHMQIKNFDCKSCSEIFSKISLLRAHMLENHNLCL